MKRGVATLMYHENVFTSNIEYRESSNATSSFWKTAKMFGLIGEKVSRVKIKKINHCVARVLLVFAK